MLRPIAERKVAEDEQRTEPRKRDKRGFNQLKATGKKSE